MNSQQHLTTRRGFIAALGFGGTTLYGMWVAYGAAPSPLAVLEAQVATSEAMPPAQGGHAGGTSMTPEAFEAEVREFVARYGEPDGSVWPRPGSDGAMSDADMAGMEPSTHGGMTMDAGNEHADPAEVDPRSGNAPVIDVWLQAARFYFEPSHLKLEAGRRYRFRMMATDIAHGASIQLGQGSRMIRLRPGSLTETEFTFTDLGEFLIYCTYYCGTAHDAMQGRLTIVEQQGSAA